MMAIGRPRVLVLGCSSGFGAAACRAFAREGFGVVGVHLDRRSTMPAVDALRAELVALDVPVSFFNLNAAADDTRTTVLDALQAEGAQVGVFLHSLAFGTLRPLTPVEGQKAVTRRQLDMTLDVMANSLVYWTHDLVDRGLMGEGGRVYAMTSSGSQRVFPQYGPVSAAKAALEAYVRQLAMELAPSKVTVNAVMAGVTDTPALRKIPGSDQIAELARRRNPSGRLTEPEDVAACLVELARSGTYWLTGNVLRIDGGEEVSA
jgi:NAD(P)-dependent dehydrogenase (short-subunit alcohol dehydrogenase family)